MWNKSIYKNWKSPKLLAIRYNIITVQNWIIEYSSMYLKAAKLVTSAALPSLNNLMMGEISWILDVNGAAIDASASDKESPTSAVFSALQSLAPSPHMAIISLVSFCNSETSDAFPSGDILANTLVFLTIFFKL